ncbi:unnamed protein product, partial [Staurois parvus]
VPHLFPPPPSSPSAVPPGPQWLAHGCVPPPQARRHPPQSPPAPLVLPKETISSNTVDSGAGAEASESVSQHNLATGCSKQNLGFYG